MFRFLFRSTPALLLGLVAQTAAAQERAPNIVLIVADDLGYHDIGVYGLKDIPTPHIDSLAKNGVRFTNGYVSCPVCSPTRAGLMTGRYQQRFGHEFNPGPANQAAEDFGLPLTETTIADHLKRAGYATGMVGKWHLGYKPQFHPQKRGFDEFFGFLGGAHSYLDALEDSANPILRGTEPVEDVGYLTDAFGREAVAFVERHSDEPFFLYLPFNAVHTPMHATEEDVAKFSDIKDRKRRIFAAMLSSMDNAVGAVLKTLREHDLESNTLVFFVGDNGGPTQANSSRNDPLSGFKGGVLEGGIRVPFLVQWKGTLPEGETYDEPVIALDILPTALAAAGARSPGEQKLDGVNLLPYLKGEKSGAPHETLFWRMGPRSAVRAGDWKLVREQAGQPWQLFNLAEDVGEKQDLAKEKRDVVGKLAATYQEWDSQLEEPRWQTQRARRARPRQRDR